MDQLSQIIGINIKEMRKKKNLTQEELAEKCELQTSYLAGVERGDRNITIQTLEKITAGLEISPSLLFNLETPLKSLSLETEQLIKMFISQLRTKSEKEIRLIIGIAEDIFEVYRQKN